MEKKFEKLMRKENVSGFLKLFEKVVLLDEIDQENQENQENINVALQAMNRFILLIRENEWPFPQELLATINRSLTSFRLNWRQRQDYILLLGSIIEKFPHEIISNPEIADELIAILKALVQADEDPGNRFRSVRILGYLGLVIPDKVLKYFCEICLQNPDKHIRINTIIALKEIAKKYGQTHAKQILPSLFEIVQNDKEDPVVLNILMVAIREINESMYEEKVFFEDAFITINVRCPFCDEYYPEESDVCTNCGQPTPKCLMCGYKIALNARTSYRSCGQCKTYFHASCLQEWRKTTKTCPHCLQILPF